MNKTVKLVLRIVGIVLAAAGIIQKGYFAINIFSDDLQPANNVAVFYIIEALGLVAVIVGLAISKYLISQIGVIVYYAAGMLLTIMQLSASGNIMQMTQLFYILLEIIIIIMIILVMAKTIKPYIAAIVIGGTVIVDGMLFVLQMIIAPGVNAFSIPIIRDLFLIFAVGAAAACTCLVSDSKK